MHPNTPTRQLKVVAYLTPLLTEKWTPALESHRILLIPSASATNVDMDAALVEAAHFADEALPHIVLDYRSRDIPIICVLTDRSPHTFNLLAAGTNGLIGSHGDGTEAAWNIWAAVRQAERCRALRKRVEQLEREKLIGQATTIIAKKLRMTAKAALSHLRAEARTRRQHIEDLAEAVIDIGEIPPEDARDEPDLAPSRYCHM